MPSDQWAALMGVLFFETISSASRPLPPRPLAGRHGRKRGRNTLNLRSSHCDPERARAVMASCKTFILPLTAALQLDILRAK
jgi:hypothetical protein